MPAHGLGRGVASLASLGLDVSLTQPRPFDQQFEAEPLAELAAGGFVPVGIGSKPVVEMENEDRGRPQNLGQAGHQGGRIGAPRAERHPRAVLRDQAARSDRFGERIERRTSHKRRW